MEEQEEALLIVLTTEYHEAILFSLGKNNTVNYL